MHLWSESTVNYILETNYELQNILKRKEKNHAKAEARIKDADKFLEQFSPEGLFEKGRELNRDFTARSAFRKELEKNYAEGLFIRDILRERIGNEDERLR